MIDVVIPAAGVGKRMGATIPKQYLMIGNKTVLETTVSKLLSIKEIGKVVISINPADSNFSTLKMLDIYKDRIVIADGGKERSDSVLNGLKKATTDFVMVHDAARPCFSEKDILELATKGCNENGAILVAPVADTIKRVDGKMNIVETIPRSQIYRALTPQLFKKDLLIKAYENAMNNNLVMTDEASAMELLGYKPKAVVGSSTNIKITEPLDLKLAEFFIENNL